MEQTFCAGEILQRVIAFCHMPVFFFCSGYFLQHSLNKHSIRELMGDKVRKLVVPYICWSFIAFSANMLLAIQNDAIIQIAGKEFGDIFIYARSVWFLIVLFITQFLSICFIYIGEHIHVNKYAIMLLSWILISICIPDVYFSIYKFKWLFPFHIIGMYYAENKEKLNGMRKYRMVSILFPILCLTLYNPLYYNMYLEFHYEDIKAGGMGAVYYLVSLLGILFVFACALLLEKTKLGNAYACIGKRSMEIYVMHMLFIKFIVVVPPQLYGNDSIWTYVYILLYSLIIIGLILLLAGKFLEKFRIYRIMVGNEGKKRRE